MKLFRTVIPLLTISMVLACQPTKEKRIFNLQEAINEVVKNKNAIIGISVLTDSSIIAFHNDTLSLPLLSVLKFPVALTALNYANSSGTSLDTLFELSADDLKTNTYSPLLSRYPQQKGNIRLDSLIFYSVALSDNNANDILMKYAGGPQAVENYLKKLGFNKIHIATDEDGMHRYSELLLENKADAISISKLFRTFIQQKLFAPEYQRCLFEILTQTSTGKDKLRNGIPDNIVLGHKTGSSPRTLKGIKIADNDAGFFLLPDHRRYYICVLIHNSSENDSTNADIISNVSRLTYEYFNIEQ